MALAPEEWAWLCATVLPPLKAKVMLRKQVDGYSSAAIAAELQITEASVRVHISTAWQRFQAYDWPECERAYVAGLLERAETDGPVRETDRQHAKALLAAMRGGGSSSPPTPTYDANGRQVATRGPLVDLDDVIEIIRAARRQRQEALAERGS